MESEQISEIIRIASIGSVLFPLALYLFRVGQASKALHLIGVLTFVSALSDITGYFLFARGQSTVVLFNVYYILTFLLLTWFYYEIYATRNGKMTIISGLVVYVIAFAVVSFYQSFLQYQTLMWTITGMTMIIYSISYFLYLFSTPSMMSNYGLLWINSGVLLYFSLNLFMFVMSSYVLTKLDSEISLLIWSFHNVNNIMKNILLALGVFAFSKTEVDQSIA
jgi:hypothetical protein